MSSKLPEQPKGSGALGPRVATRGKQLSRPKPPKPKKVERKRKRRLPVGHAEMQNPVRIYCRVAPRKFLIADDNIIKAVSSIADSTNEVVTQTKPKVKPSVDIVTFDTPRVDEL